MTPLLSSGHRSGSRCAGLDRLMARLWCGYLVGLLASCAPAGQQAPGPTQPAPAPSPLSVVSVSLAGSQAPASSPAATAPSPPLAAPSATSAGFSAIGV